MKRSDAVRVFLSSKHAARRSLLRNVNELNKTPLSFAQFPKLNIVAMNITHRLPLMAFVLIAPRAGLGLEPTRQQWRDAVLAHSPHYCPDSSCSR